MIIRIQFPDNHEETFYDATNAAKAMGVTTATVISAAKNGKKKLIRRRDKAEFQIECLFFPRIKIWDGKEEYSFSSLKLAEEFFDLPKILSSKVRFDQNLVVDMQGMRFLKITEHNGKPFARQEEKNTQGKFQRSHKGPKVYYQKAVPYKKLTPEQKFAKNGGKLHFSEIH